MLNPEEGGSPVEKLQITNSMLNPEEGGFPVEKLQVLDNHGTDQSCSSSHSDPQHCIEVERINLHDVLQDNFRTKIVPNSREQADIPVRYSSCRGPHVLCW